jgi:hypothetical protein
MIFGGVLFQTIRLEMRISTFSSPPSALYFFRATFASKVSTHHTIEKIGFLTRESKFNILWVS